MIINAVIIDDEKHSRATLQDMVQEYCPEVHIAGLADGCKSGVEIIEKCNPQLVFLDIQMPDGSGFRVLEQTKKMNFEVIFTTAYDSFAIKAFKYSALDYLLKPIDGVELQNAVDKAVQRKATASGAAVEMLLENLKRKDKPGKIVLSTFKGLHVVEICQIVRCKSEDYYTRFFFKDKTDLLVSKTLKEYESILEDHQFIRPHKSHLINIEYVKNYVKSDGGAIHLTDGTKIPVARRKRDAIIKLLKDLD